MDPLGIELSFDRREMDFVDASLRSLPRRLLKSIQQTLGTNIERAAFWMIQRRLSGRPGLNPRSGTLIRSIRWASQLGPREILARIWVDPQSLAAVYAPVHEFGATIRAVHQEYLTIVIERPGAEPIFRRKKEVTIPPRPFFQPTADHWFPIITEAFGESVQEALVANA